MKRNVFSLRNLVDKTSPDLIFLSEIQLFSSDVSHCMSMFKGEYICEINSEDKHDIEISMTKSKACGGTMILWRKSLDKYISVFPHTSSSFLPVIFSPPGSPISAHFALYLPTSGKEDDFLNQFCQLSLCIDEILEKFPDCLLFIRGDGNINTNNMNRVQMLASFLSTFSLKQLKINHKTYHHFMGRGSFDSNIDVILFSSGSKFDETLSRIFCKLDNPDMESHHDAIVTSICFPVSPHCEEPQDLLVAPKVDLSRHKVLWSQEGISLYQQEVSADLSQARITWLNPLSRTSLAVLLLQTNEILTRAAISTNKTIILSAARTPKSVKKPKEVRQSETVLKKALENVRNATNASDRAIAHDHLKKVRINHKQIVRSLRNNQYMKHDEQFFNILTSNPSSAFSAIRAAKPSSQVQVPFIMVGDKKYPGDRVIDGFYDSISTLKSLNDKKLAQNPHHTSLIEDYEYIKLLCANKMDLPPISIAKSKEILFRMKASVMDFYSLTPYHFIHAGISGLVHFNLLMNAFIVNVNNCSISELNNVLALLLYKGHSKDRTLDASYRTISTCPLLAKSLDIYVRDLFISDWNSSQADTQYQGERSSHDLASLMITETVLYAKYKSSLPTFLLFLDARSAFDTVVTPYLVRKLFFTGMHGNSLLYTDSRLSNRTTYCQFDKSTVGPIVDDHGVEQGGVSSSDFYKVYNNELLTTAQESKLGASLGGSLVISAVGQADDTVLVSNDIFKLQHILHLVLGYCKKFNVKLSSSKTKLLMIPAPRSDGFTPYNPINIDGEDIPFVDEAEHVGVLRAVSGNVPNTLQRISAFKKSLGPLIACGLARGSRSNPAASLRILSIYATPVLLSGLPSLVLSSNEISSIDQQYKRTLQNILKLSVNSPPALVYFIAGSLPLTAILHMRQLSLFAMVSRLPTDPLNIHARNTLLTSSPSEKSWFVIVRNLCLLYDLPHPLHVLDNPLPKKSFAKLLKSRVCDYWEVRLRQSALPLLDRSLRFFKPQFMSLFHPHVLVSSAGKNPYEVSKARIQLKFLAGQYPCGELTRHWSSDNNRGLCTYPPCFTSGTVESREHVLLHCPAYSEVRTRLLNMCLKVRSPVAQTIIVTHLLQGPTSIQMQLLLDSSVLPGVIVARQNHGDQVLNDLLHLGRTWCFSVHRGRLKRLKLWNYD